MRVIFLTLLISVAGLYNLYSQNLTCCFDSLSEKIYEQKIVARLFVNPLINNNVQYFGNWTKGNVYLSNGDVINNEILRLNRYLNELMWLRKSDYKTGIADKKLISGFMLSNVENKDLEFKKVRIKNWYAADSIDVYLQILLKGDMTLGIFRTSRLNKNSNELTLKNVYYIVKNNKSYNIKPGKRSLYSLPFIDKARMKAIIKDNHIKVRKEEGLKKVIELYNISNTVAR